MRLVLNALMALALIFEQAAIVVFAQLGQLSLQQLLIIPIPLENPDEPGAGRHRIHLEAPRRMAH